MHLSIQLEHTRYYAVIATLTTRTITNSDNNIPNNAANIKNIGMSLRAEYESRPGTPFSHDTTSDLEVPILD